MLRAFFERKYYNSIMRYFVINNILFGLCCIIMVTITSVYAQPHIHRENITDTVSTEVKQQIEVLFSDKASERVAAVTALGKIKAVVAIPFLIELFDDTDPVILRSQEGTAGITSPGKIAVGALAAIGSPAVTPLIAALQDNRSNVRMNSAAALGKIKNSRAVEPLINTIKDEDIEVRKNAAAALGEIGDSRALEPLSVCLRNSKYNQRQLWSRAVKDIINWMISGRDREPLIRALSSEEPLVRQMAAEALRELKDTKAVEPLIKTLREDDDPRVRRVAVEALGEIQNARAIVPLVALLKDKDKEVRESVVTALQSMNMPDIEALLPFLKDSDDEVRIATIRILCRIENDRIAVYLIEALNDKSWIIRSEAAKSLGVLRIPETLPSLIQALNDKNMSVRLAVEASLISIGSPVLQPLIYALKEPDVHIQSSAAKILGELGDSESVVPLIEALNVNSWVVRSEAAIALGKIKDKRALAPLYDTTNDKDSYVREVAAGAIKLIKSD
ncbi:MAG: HEAT repeat domain-containing protein [Thermodesulfovibrionales bacterium]|nr:HEAT repeat domain-containing protein [Thermodesulfovibrionales bacterium]